VRVNHYKPLESLSHAATVQTWEGGYMLVPYVIHYQWTWSRCGKVNATSSQLNMAARNEKDIEGAIIFIDSTNQDCCEPKVAKVEQRIDD